VSTEALLIMDVQNGIVSRLGGRADTLLATLADAIGFRSSSRVPVVYVRVAFRPGGPEMSPKNRIFAALAGSDAMDEIGPGHPDPPRCGPDPEKYSSPNDG